MSYPTNFLRTHRRRSPLTQSDIARLSKLPDDSNISRCEKGQRAPSMELLLVYHHLFDTSVESFFEPQSSAVLLSLIEESGHLINEIKKEESIPRNIARMKFLEQVIIRLSK